MAWNGKWVEYEGSESTGIVGITADGDGQPETGDAAGAWFTMDGRKLSSKPAQKGIFIHNGKKVVIK